MLTAWNVSDMGAAAPRDADTLEVLHHRGQVAGSKGVGRVQGFRGEMQVQPTPRTTPEAGPWPSKRQEVARCKLLITS